MIVPPTNELKHIPSDTTVALIRPINNKWSILIGTTGANPKIISSIESISSEKVDEYITKNESKFAIVMIPASMTAVRSFHLPNSDDEELELALRLQAEAHFLGSAPSHRVGYGLLGKKATKEGRLGLCLAWPQSAKITIPEISIPVRYAPETAGIIALSGPSYEQKFVLCVSAQNESITILMRSESGLQIRCTREIPTNGSFTSSIKRLIKEAGIRSQFGSEQTKRLEGQISKFKKIIDSGKPLLLGFPFDYLEKTAENTSRDAGWWGIFGAAVGLLKCSDSTLSSCLNLSVDEPKVRLKQWEKIGLKLAEKNIMLKIALAASILIAVLPPTFQYLRLSILNSQFTDIEKKVSVAKTNQRRIAMYKSLGNMTWPMSKLLGDLSANTPRGINIEQISITQGQPITLLGVALKNDSGDTNSTPAELIALMQKQLAEDKVFGDVNFKYQEADDFSGTRDFQMSIPVLSPMLMISYGKEKDYGLRTLAMRKAGVEPDDLTPEGLIKRKGNNTTSSSSSRNEQNTSNSNTVNNRNEQQPVTTDNDDKEANNVPNEENERERRNSGRTRRVGDGSDSMGSRFDNGTGAAPGSIPPPISDGQLALMGQSEVMDALKKVSAAKQVATEESDQDRLDDDLQRLMGRLRELRKK